MKINFVETKTNCPVAIIDDFFSRKELSDIKKELLTLTEHIDNGGIFTNDIGSATDASGTPKRVGNGLLIDSYYAHNRNESDILKINRKVFTDKSLLNKLENKSIFYRAIKASHRDFMLLNMYKKSGSYGEHSDASTFTVMTFFDIHKFNGGDLLFPEFNISVDSLDNRAVIFPGFLKHAVSKVTEGTRISIAHFINY